MDEALFDYNSKTDKFAPKAMKSFSGNPYSNFLGIGAGKDKAQAIKEATMAKFSPLSKNASCDDVQIELDKVQSEMDALRGKITSGEKSKWYAPALGYLEEMKAKYKNMFSSMQCEKKQLEAESSAATQQTVDILSKVTTGAGTPQSGSKTTTYIIYGVGALLVLGAVLIFVKKD